MGAERLGVGPATGHQDKTLPHHSMLTLRNEVALTILLVQCQQVGKLLIYEATFEIQCTFMLFLF